MVAKHSQLRTREAPPHVKAFILKFRDPAPIDAIRGQIGLQVKPRILVLETWFGNDLRVAIDRDADNRKIAAAIDAALGPGSLNPWRFEITW